MSQHVFVLYASNHGHTRKIAEHVAAQLVAAGLTADVGDVRADREPVDLRRYDGVIVGASVHGGHHQDEIVEWIGDHRTRLNAMPSAFFSVSLSAADDSEDARGLVRRRVDDLLEATGWMPKATATFAGALQFEEYNLPTRILMRLIAHRQDPSADLHKDTDYTDWPLVDRFAAGFAAALQATEVSS